MAQMTKKQYELFESLRKSQVEDLKTFSKGKYRGIWNSIIDKYPEAAHFVYELLQNADDADATNVHIKVSPNTMLFKHNGKKHFDITDENSKIPGDINAITGIGNTSKDDAHNKIGKFGVGFKAVFQYTDNPEIYDDVFKFRIIEYIVPELLQKDHPFREEGETLFVFPFKSPEKAYNDIVKRIETLRSPILFLSHIEKIYIEVEDKYKKIQKYEYSKSVQKSKTFNDGISLKVINLTNPKSEETVFMFSRNVLITDDEKKSNHQIYVGYYYDRQKREIITSINQNVFCFFPTKENFNTCFVCHAPFLLTDNRQNLKPSEDVNRYLLTQLSILAAKSVLCLRDYGKELSKTTVDKNVTRFNEKYPQRDKSINKLLIDENILNILPKYFTQSQSKWYYDEYERYFIDSFEEIVENEKIFLSRNGKYLTKENSYTGTPKELVDLLSAQQLKELTREDDNVDFLKWELIRKLDECDLIEKHYTSSSFAEDITPQFMGKQELKWVSKMYTFLKEDARNLWNFTSKDFNKEYAYKPFRDAPIIKTENGQWVAPFNNNITPNVFLPLGNKISVGYNIIHQDYIDDKISENFFKELGISVPDELDYIRQIILKRYKEEDVDIDDDILISDLDFLLNYYINHTEEERNQMIDMIKNYLLLVSEDSYLTNTNSLYIADNNLRKFIRGDKDSIIDNNFYKGIIDKYHESIFIEFCQKLGVSTILRIKKKNYIAYYNNLPKELPKGIKDDIKEHINVNDVKEWVIDDISLDYFASVINEKKWSKEMSLYIWNEVLSAYNLDDYNFLDLKFKEHRKRSYYRISHDFISTFKYELNELAWIYDVNGNLVSPKDVVLEDLSIEYIKNENVIRFLGIKKRERSIIELGATEEEQRLLDFARAINQTASNLTMDEVLVFLQEKSVEKQRNETFASVVSDKNDASSTDNKKETGDEKPSNIETKLQEKWNQKANSNIGKPQKIKNRDTDLSNLATCTHNHETKEPLFGNSKNHEFYNNIENNKEDISKVEKKLTQKDTLAQEAAQKATEQKQIYELLTHTPQYSFKWYKLLMELMHADKSNVSSRHVQLDFSEREFICDNKVLHLSNPTQPVPNWILDAETVSISTLGDNPQKIDGIIVKVDDVSADVSIEPNDKLYDICKSAKKIRVIADNSANIINSLKTRFIQLGFDDEYNMNDNLTKDIEFIYGPPGTGKTTRLVKRVSDILKCSKEKLNILVLTPTNKAADVIAERMVNNDICYNYLTRFGATENLYLIEDAAIVTNRETLDINLLDNNIVVTTAARYAYDYLQPDETFLCDFNWDYIIIDEASMLDIITCTYILHKGSSAKFIISGDPKQIQPVSQNDMPAYNIYDMVGLNDFSEAVNNYTRYNVTTLKTQHRSIPAIGDLVSKFAYNGIVKADPNRAKQKPLELDKLPIRNINYIGFEILDFDLIKGLTSVSESAFHLYSAIFTYNFAEYIIKQITEKYPGKEYSIGIVSPYRAEANAIKQLLENRPINTEYCSITCGTVHSFQGDECDIMLIVLNPPVQCSRGAHINNQNIINVAMSRARDYIFFIMPQGQYKGMIIKEQLGYLTPSRDCGMFYSSDIEKIMFGDNNYIVSNTHVTCHMPVNVYCEENSRYEVRISDDALDIKVKL